MKYPRPTGTLPINDESDQCPYLRLRNSALIYVLTYDFLDYIMPFSVVPTIEYYVKEQTNVDWVVGCACLSNDFAQMDLPGTLCN